LRDSRLELVRAAVSGASVGGTATFEAGKGR
jgi:hypothetical protein